MLQEGKCREGKIGESEMTLVILAIVGNIYLLFFSWFHGYVNGRLVRDDSDYTKEEVGDGIRGQSTG